MIEDAMQLPQVVNDKMRDELVKALREMSDSMIRADSEKDLQKAIAERMKEEHQVPKKYFNKLARIYHAANLMDEMARNEEFMNFAEAVLSPPAQKVIANEDESL